MSGSGTDRGFRGILLALCQQPASVPFSCPPQEIVNEDNSTSIIEIKNGAGNFIHQKNKECAATKSSSAKQRKRTMNHPKAPQKRAAKDTKEGQIDNNPEHQDEETVQDIMNEFHEAKEKSENNEPEKTAAAEEDNGQEAKDNSKESNSGEQQKELNQKQEHDSSSYSSSSDDENEKEIMIIDGKVSDNCDDNEKALLFRASKSISNSVSNLYNLPVISISLYFKVKDKSLEILESSTVATSDATIYSNQDDIEGKFSEFYIRSVSKPIDKQKCCNYSSECKKPDFPISRSSYLLYLAEKEFPNADASKLDFMIKQRIAEEGTDPTIFCCVRCYHLFSSANFASQIASEQYRFVSNDPDPLPFQPLVPAELKTKERYPVGFLFDGDSRPYHIVSNLERSPYKCKAPTVKKPVTVHARAVTRSAPRTVKLHIDQSETNQPRKISHELKPKPSKTYKLKPYENPNEKKICKGVSQSYEKVPFNLSILDPKRKKRLHCGNEQFTDRFDQYIKMDDTTH